MTASKSFVLNTVLIVTFYYVVKYPVFVLEVLKHLLAFLEVTKYPLVALEVLKYPF